MQNTKHDLVAAEAHHKQEVQILSQEHEEKLKQLQKKNNYLNHQLEKSYVPNQQYEDKISTLEKHLKESHLVSVVSSFSRLTVEKLKQLACKLHE